MPVAAKEAFAWLRDGQKGSAGRGGASRPCRKGNSIVGKEIRSSLEKFLDAFPSVTRQQAIAALELAGEALAERAHPH